MSVLPHATFGNLNKSPVHSLSAANGTPINAYGSKLIQVSLGLRRTFWHEFILAEVNRPIIGADFLSKHGLLIDIQNKRLVDPLTELHSSGTVATVDTPTPKFFSISGEYAELLKQYPKLLSAPDYNVPVKHSVVHFINTKDNLPFSKPRRLDGQRYPTAKAEFQHMLNLEICRASSSPSSSPWHMVQKSDLDWRPSGDYRRLNAVMYPIPHIQDLLL